MAQPDVSLVELLRAVADTPAETLGLLMLTNDPAAARLSIGSRRAAVRAALDDGAAGARGLAARWDTSAPDAIARSLGIALVDSDAEAQFGSLLRYAEYRSDPPEIHLFRRALARLDRALADPAIGGLLGIATSAPVFVAHAIYHHVELTRAALPLGRRHAVTARFGPLRWRRSLPSLSEIAAGACAQTLLGLPHHPKLLDLIALYDRDPAAAARMIGAIVELGPTTVYASP